MSVYRKWGSMLLAGGVGAGALWWAWPERAVPANGPQAAVKVSDSVRATEKARVEKIGKRQAATVAGADHASIRKKVPDGVPVDTDPMQVRCREVEAWAASGSETGVEKVIAAAKADPELKETAVRALGRTQSAKAAEYVASVLSDEDPAMVCAAIGAWAAMKGEAAIPDVAAILENNRNRSDGWQSDVALACVMALGEIRSSEALPVLEKEMQWVSQQKSKLGYGAALIEAVADIGDSRGAVMLEEYADELRGKLAGDPLIRRGQMLLLSEALSKADVLR
jgi:hypothetical protein